MDYEELVAAIAHIDAARNLMFAKTSEDEMLLEVDQSITEARNRLNKLRLTLLGNGHDRPFDVDEMKRQNGIQT